MTKRLSRKTFVASLIVTALSLMAVSYALLGHGVGAGPRIIGIVLGVLGLFIGIAMLAPRLVPAARARRRHTRSAAMGGAVAGRAERAKRDPELRSRTAATAAALMIGLALVTFVAVFGTEAWLASDKDASRPADRHPLPGSPRRTAGRRELAKAADWHGALDSVSPKGASGCALGASDLASEDQLRPNNRRGGRAWRRRRGHGRG